jgi:hypothetical protein
MSMKKIILEMIEYQLTESIGDAVNDLADTIKHDGYSKGLEDKIADEYDVNPALLSRMFKQKYNKDPKDFVIVDIDDKILDAAKRKAKEYRNIAGFSGEFEKYVGKPFNRGDNKKYVFVAYTNKGIHAISIPAQKEKIISFENRRYASAFLRANIKE